MTPPPPPLKSRQPPLPDKTSCERSQIKEYLALTTSPSLPLHGLSFLITMWLNPFASGNYAEKHFLKLVKPFSDQCLAVKGKNCPNRSQVEHNFAAFCPRCNMHVLASKDRACWSLDMSNKTNSTLTSCFFFSPLLSLFCPVFFFCQAFATRLFLMAQVFRKAQDQMQGSAGGWWNKIFIGIFGHGFVDSSLFIFLCIFFLFYIF